MAGVQHKHRRGIHCFRRRAVDLLLDARVPIAVLVAAGGWKNPRMPMRVYREKERDLPALAARDALEGLVPAVRRPSQTAGDADASSEGEPVE